MVDRYRREWDGAEWETFSRRLVQLRHGAQNVQDVPSKVRGDAGIEFISTDGSVYQSYAPEETFDVKKAASAMKGKATRDLPKLKKYENVVGRLLGTRKVNRWILLCPFLDDKEVIAHVAAKAAEVYAMGVKFLQPDFCALVQSQVDFAGEIEQLRLASMGAPLLLKEPTEEEVQIKTSLVGKRLDNKLARGFPQESVEQRQRRRQSVLKSHIRAANALDQLKNEMPEIWERAYKTVRFEEERLAIAGAQSGTPQELLQAEMAHLQTILEKALPSLDATGITAIAQGQVGTWLIECPLDFTDTKVEVAR